MFESDSSTFDRAFKRVSGAYRLKLAKVEAEELSRTYFKVLEPWPLDEVLAAGKKCMLKCKRFPAVAEWVAELPATVDRVAPGDMRWMSADEMDVHERAAAKRYRDEPCACPECFYAGIHARPIRFVPTLAAGDTYERAFNSRRHQVELLGHWAHGEELARWYQGRDHFFGLKARTPRIGLLLSIARAVLEREPGMEG